MFYRVLLLCCCLFAAAGSYAQTDAEYEQQLKALSKSIEQLQQQLSEVKSSRDELESSLEGSEKEASELIKKIEAIKEALAKEKKQLAQHQRQRADLEDSRQQQQQEITLVIQQAYLLGHQSQLKMLLNQEEPYRISRLLRYHEYVVNAQKQKLDRYLATIAEIQTVEDSIAQSSQKLEESQSSLSQRLSQLQDTQANRLQTLAKLSDEMKAKGGELNQLQTDQKRLERLLEEATKALSQLKIPQRDAVAFAKLRGKLPYPAEGKVVNSYGSARLGGQMRWQGIVLRGELGSQVVSVHHGRVIFSDYLRGQGLLIIIDHGDGYMSLYAHNQTLLKATGDWVSAGEPVATIGNTGGQVQAGLYFEIRLKGKTLNPQKWLNRG